MNEQQYRKQLLLQQIDARRGLTRMEVERVKDLNPARPYVEMVQQLSNLAGSIGSGGRAGGIASGGLPLKLDLGMIVPFAIQIATSLLKRRKKGRG